MRVDFDLDLRGEHLFEAGLCVLRRAEADVEHRLSAQRSMISAQADFYESNAFAFATSALRLLRARPHPFARITWEG